MATKTTTVRISLRLPPALHTRLRESAQDDRRSLQGQIVWLLEHTMATREATGQRVHERDTRQDPAQ
jgi:hypothetical protein